MDKKTFQEKMRAVNKSHTLLTPKHNPNNSDYIYSSYTSVLTHEVSSSLDTMIESGDYDIYEYHNNNPFHNSAYYVIRPCSSCSFSIAASGIHPYSTTPPEALDRLILVSGSNIGFHFYGDNQSKIDEKVSTGEHTFICKLENNDE